jgi:predicted MFS family arabinose efflux permease
MVTIIMFKTKNKIDVNSTTSIVSIILISSIAPIVLLVAPVLVGIFISTFGLTPQQSGYLISSEMAGMGLAALPALYWIKKINWQKVALLALLIAGLGQIITMWFDTFIPLLIVRFINGLAAGTAMSVCLASINLTNNPERVFGFWVVGQLLFGAIAIAALPFVIDNYGVSGFYLPLGVVLLLLTLLVKNLPTYTVLPSTKKNEHSSIQATSVVPVVMAMIGLFIFYMGLSGAWTYIERLGNQAGLDITTIANTLFFASIAGIIGALIASILSNKWGRAIPASIGLLFMTFALIILAAGVPYIAITSITFIFAACLFKLTWTFSLPYLLSSISRQDNTGHTVVITNFIIGIGLTAGPAISAMILTGNDYTAIMWMAALFVIVSFILFYPLLLDRKVKQTKI